MFKRFALESGTDTAAAAAATEETDEDDEAGVGDGEPRVGDGVPRKGGGVRWAGGGVPGADRGGDADNSETEIWRSSLAVNCVCRIVMKPKQT